MIRASPVDDEIKQSKSFCGGPGGSFFKKRPLAAGGKTKQEAEHAENNVRW